MRSYIIFGAAVLLGIAAFFAFSNFVQADAPVSSRSKVAISTWTPSLEKELSDQDLELGSPVFFRVVKTREGHGKGYLEGFVENSDQEFVLFKKWDICTWSGDLGPKLKQGDGQSPEGFYFVTLGRMNPYSSYHLSFNLGYPNAYDRAHGRTGDYLMIHGDCVSIGCYAMTDEGIEEIYTLMSAAFQGGQPYVRVHSFPFEMSESNINRFAENPNIEFWKNLKQGWDWFETHKRPPDVTVKSKVYQFGEG